MEKQTNGPFNFDTADAIGVVDHGRRVIKLLIEAASKFSSSVRSRGLRETRVHGDEKLEWYLAA